MATPSEPLSFELEEHQEKNNLLLLFAASKKSPGYVQQMRILEATPASEFFEHDLLLVRVLDEGPSKRGEQPITETSAEALRRRFEVKDDFALVLVGKDGAVKRRDDAPVESSVIFGQIGAPSERT